MSQYEKIKACKMECEELRKRIDELRGGDSETNYLADGYAGQTAEINLKQRRILKGHFGKIYAMHWAVDSKHIVSASQDGKLIIWQALTTNKVEAIPLRSSWVMTCAYSPSGRYVACGGLDNLCSIYKLTFQENPSAGISEHKGAFRELAQHEGYLSCCRFIDDHEIITSSGDSTCILWDIEQNRQRDFLIRIRETLCRYLFLMNGIYLFRGRVTQRRKYTTTEPIKCVATFPGHESDINSVQFFPDGHAFCTGSDDSSCRFFDLRSKQQLQIYANDTILCGITSVAFSKTGKFLFAGYDDYNCYVWDTLTGAQAQQLQGHENRVSCLGVNNTGLALCTGSWDTLLKIWA
eukprot:TRINITY_DN452_c1_g1_i1.p1 TRINITY_DN452_c1_g1~~TRINITY_DN452_c1_g1_i1.p1  ORF type:complete len:350 (-),score=62.54 TRINITY_DN452_c1_g1_i1:818-1867(-)